MSRAALPAGAQAMPAPSPQTLAVFNASALPSVSFLPCVTSHALSVSFISPRATALSCIKPSITHYGGGAK